MEGTAVGRYQSNIFPQLKGKLADIVRFGKGNWVAGRFLGEQGEVFIIPTREEGVGYDATRNWIMYHEDDFDIVTGALEPASKTKPVFDDLRDGAIVKPVEDQLAKLARIIGQDDLFKERPASAFNDYWRAPGAEGYEQQPGPYKRPGDEVIDAIAAIESHPPVEFSELAAHLAGGGFVAGPSSLRNPAFERIRVMDETPPPDPWRGLRWKIAIICLCWFLTGIAIGWWIWG